MSTTTSLPPGPKIKACLASIKDRFFPAVGGAADDPHHDDRTQHHPAAALADALLQLELLLRGVFVVVDPDNRKPPQPPQPQSVILLVSPALILTHAGKPAASSSLLPPPLRAGTCALAGRLAEELAAAAPDSANEDATGSTIDDPRVRRASQQPQPSTATATDWNDAVARCQQVQDERLMVLLQLLFLVDTTTANATTTTTSTTLACCYYTLAEGYYWQAATLQPDAPPMWKKVWDCCVAAVVADSTHNHSNKHGHAPPVVITWQAIEPLSHLIRIAQHKGNHKRAVELSLILADCYLDMFRTTTTATTNKPDSAFQSQLRRIFLSEHRPLVVSQELQSSAVSHAMACLERVVTGVVEPSDPASSYLQWRLLELRVRVAQQEHEIAAAARADLERARNRATTSTTTTRNTPTPTTTTTTTLEAYQVQARRRRLVQEDGVPALHSCAVAVRDQVYLVAAVLPSSTASTSSSRYYYHSQACTELTRYVEYLRDRARELALHKGNNNINNNGWNTLADFVRPILQQHPRTNAENEAPSSWPMEERDLLETACVSLVMIEWMWSGSLHSDNHYESVFGPDLWWDTRCLLQALMEQRRIEQQQQQVAAATAVIGGNSSSESPAELLWQRLDGARVSLDAMLALRRHHSWDASTPTARAAATAAASLRNTERWDAELGVSYWICWWSWSGWTTSRPWLYCTQPEARRWVDRAQASVRNAQSQWGRQCNNSNHRIEPWGLRLCRADAETVFDQGLTTEALSHYHGVWTEVTALSLSNVSAVWMDLVVARCCTGVAQLGLREPDLKVPPEMGTADAMARQGLERLENQMARLRDGGTKTFPDASGPTPLYVWRSNLDLVTAVVQCQVATCRRILADALLRRGETITAQTVLEDAVRDAPQDANAALALGSFRLRVALFGDTGLSDSSSKSAQMQLLQAAKMDSRQAGPFALLGYFYEHKDDMKRAVGCYSKALLLDPSHPVAGRGVLRLAPRNSLTKVLDKAIAGGSAVVGWAWHAMARQKSMVEGDDNMGLVALLNALRCRDLDCPSSEPLSVFYAAPSHPELPSRMEMSYCLADLAACYYRLGRYTASIRSYHSAIQEAGERCSSSLLCCCAQVEMELGLFEDAENRFSRAIDLCDSASAEISLVAKYGRSVSLAALAQRDNQDGKSGLAKQRVQQAVDGCHAMSEEKNLGCVEKLVGDLYTFAASLPPDVFVDSHDASEEEKIRSQLSFISKGDTAFCAAIQLIRGADEENHMLRASLFTDAGVNLLLQAQLLSSWETKGLHKKNSPEASAAFDRAAVYFRRAIDVDPSFAPAWCGYGCAIAQSDPLIAQHAFSRSLELDNLSPDSYANFSFLLTHFRKFAASASVSEALTEVADTPMMWINRAFILESEAARIPGEEDSRRDIQQAADAYRAALQVVKHPSAMLGLAMTCRMSLSEKDNQNPSMVFESRNSTTEYLAMLGRIDAPTLIFNGILSIESAQQSAASYCDQMIAEGREQVLQGIRRLEAEDLSDHQSVTLDTSLLQQVTVKQASLTSPPREEEVANTWNLDRQVLHEPNRGDLWVELAKDLTSKGCVVPAARAIGKGLSILTQQLSGLLALPRDVHFVKSEDLSDALSMNFWLENMNDTTAEVQPRSQASIVDLQRSLLIAPGNPVARAAMISLCHPPE